MPDPHDNQLYLKAGRITKTREDAGNSYAPLHFVDNAKLLDDLDKMQSITDGSFQRQTLHMLFNQRYNARRPIIITANKDDGWDQWLDKATRPRLFYGYAKAEAISMQGQDYRMMRALNFPSLNSHQASKRNQEEQ